VGFTTTLTRRDETLLPLQTRPSAGLLATAGTSPNGNDPLGEAYSLIRKALGAVTAASLPVSAADELFALLYEAEDVTADLIRKRK
jgi:hypothetical protein